MRLTKNQIKSITALRHKKYRDERGLFIAEGEKLVNELISAGVSAVEMYALEAESNRQSETSTRVFSHSTPISESDMNKISGLANPSAVMGIFEIPKESIKTVHPEQKLVVALDGIQDPGNMGTIIRLCLWFGIENIICSFDTVDCYNPKVVQSSMGAIAKVHLQYVDLSKYLTSVKATNVQIFGAFLDGENIYQTSLSSTGIVVMGNEGNGISSEVARLIDNRITIPSFMDGSYGAESLNVATATAITLSEFKRRCIKP